MTTPYVNAELAAAVHQLFTRLTPPEKRISVALYRMLAEGRPVAREALAARARLPLAQVYKVLDNWFGVFYDDAGKIIGYQGLTLREMHHRLRTGGRTLYAWCAWDTLFLPQIIGAAAEVESSCPVTGDAIRLAVNPREVQSVDPVGTMMSFVAPDESKVRENVVLNFCHYVHFFRSTQAAEVWRSQQSGTRILTVAEAWALGREKNAFQYGNVWGLASGVDTARDAQPQSCCAG